LGLFLIIKNPPPPPPRKLPKTGKIGKLPYNSLKYGKLSLRHPPLSEFPKTLRV